MYVYAYVLMSSVYVGLPIPIVAITLGVSFNDYGDEDVYVDMHTSISAAYVRMYLCTESCFPLCYVVINLTQKSFS